MVSSMNLWLTATPVLSYETSLLMLLLFYVIHACICYCVSALLSMVIAMILSVSLFVCLSVTLCYNVNKRRPTVMQFLPCDALKCKARYRMSSVCRSVRPSVCLSVTLVNCDHIGWNSSKIISPLVSLGRSLYATPTWRVCFKGNTPKFGHKMTHPLLIWASETFDRKLRPNGYR